MCRYDFIAGIQWATNFRSRNNDNRVCRWKEVNQPYQTKNHQKRGASSATASVTPQNSHKKWW